MKSLSDISEPATVTRKLLEADVQKQCVDWARNRGYRADKFKSESKRSVPDYIFSAPSILVNALRGTGKIKFMTEFKRPGGKSTEAQLEEQQSLRLAGWYVFECDNFDKFKATVIAYEKEQA